MTPESLLTPGRGELLLALRIADATFIGRTPIDGIDALLASTERRMGIRESDRTDEIRQASLRVHVVERLADRTVAERDFVDHLAAATLWLAVNHHRYGSEMRAGIDELAARDGCAVLSVGVAAGQGEFPGTAWVFAVSERETDLRNRLPEVGPGHVDLISR